ncbi:DivIVA domain-containing protein [Clostridium oryzae]|uniref:Septum site-determining protein DivIVA n=1 Tax=Clostridium oryzae TaxID=1450648 RepID=A0A1V4ITJ7_9CLOT|nr:DivIVA domain-containing protein [Clostridium oryzae]OPJ63229.1 septum site-determining protein DivIVA [Clostridium oryzae]
MRLTAMDINSKEFKKGFRGYNIDEVDEFILKVSEDYEALYKENSTMKDKISNLNEKIQHYSKIEDTIQNTLILAQNAADQAKTNAQKEAELIIKNANDTAQKILEKAHNDVMTVNGDYDRLKQEFAKFRAKFRNFMKTQMETFDDLEKDFAKNYNVGTPVEEINEKEIVSSQIPKEEEIVEHSFNDDELNEIKKFFASEE